MACRDCWLNKDQSEEDEIHFDTPKVPEIGKVGSKKGQKSLKTHNVSHLISRED